jgi:hypothetical protein
MYALSLAAVVFTGLAVGSVIGTIFGFSLASHHDVLAGRRPNTSNRFLKWICRPTREFGLGESLLFLLLMLLWVVVFFAFFAIPVVVAVKIDGEDSSLMGVAIATCVAASFFARHIGSKLWQRLLHAA